MFNFLYFVVKEIYIDDLSQVFLPTNVDNFLLSYYVQLTTEGDLWRHRVLDSRSTRHLSFGEFIVVIHQFFDVTGGHEVVQGLFETTHVGAV